MVIGLRLAFGHRALHGRRATRLIGPSRVGFRADLDLGCLGELGIRSLDNIDTVTSGVRKVRSKERTPAASASLLARAGPSNSSPRWASGQEWVGRPTPPAVCVSLGTVAASLLSPWSPIAIVLAGSIWPFTTDPSVQACRSWATGHVRGTDGIPPAQPDVRSPRTRWPIVGSVSRTLSSRRARPR